MSERRSLPNRVHDKVLCLGWARQHPWCFACGVPASRAPWPGCQVHHVAGGIGRSDETTNLMTLCSRCHGLFHGDHIRKPDGTYWPRLTLGMILTLKSHHDPDEYDPERLAVLLHESLPEQELIPEAFQEEYRRWRPKHPIPGQ